MNPPELRKIYNPPNPYLSDHRELLGEPPVAELEIYEDTSKTVLTKNDSPDLGFSYSVNPYRGCFHSCTYCYARPTHEYLGLGAGSDFERKIFVKKNAPELLRKAFSKKSWKNELVIFSGITDCYQPVEAAWKLTRGCLQVCLEKQNPIGIITKSALIRRDVDILSELAKVADVSVSFSIPFADEEICRAIEPGTPLISKRFETMNLLAQAGILVGIGVAPIIPGLNDSHIPTLLKRAKENGASFAFRTIIRLSGSVEPVFFHHLKEKLPLKYDLIRHLIQNVRGGKLNESRFGLRHRGVGNYWKMIEQMWDVWVRKTGLDHGEAIRTREKRPNHAQLTFF